MSAQLPNEARRVALAGLQLADSSLPIGRFAHSNGTERWLSENPSASSTELEQLVSVSLTEAIAPLDGAALNAAHRAETATQLLELDALLTAHKSASASRAASQSCGRQLAQLAQRLVQDELLADYCALVDSRQSEGNLAIVEGVLARATAIPAEMAVLISLRSAASGMLSAAVRLGRLTPSLAQVSLRTLAGSVDRATTVALATKVGEWHSTAAELEICLLASGREEISFFAS
jgi:urease accessory protein